ncbi:MAG TPA: helix-turn-helix domain-containing protein [Steroidobacter sp.]
MTNPPHTVQRLVAGNLPWHEHRDAYVAVVLNGSYQETGDQGRLRAEAGHVLLHLPFERHANHVATDGARVVNIPVSLGEALHLRSMRSADPEQTLRAISQGQSIVDALAGGEPGPFHWLDEEADALALGLTHGDEQSFETFAAEHGIAGRTLRRRFEHLYGISAAKFRARARARSAWREILTSTATFATIACNLGFADQAHMCRAVATLTGASPSAWRRQLAI